MPFLTETHLQVRLFGWFLSAMAQTTRSRARMCLLGIKNLKLIFNVFTIYFKHSKKITVEPMVKIKQFLKTVITLAVYKIES